MDRIAFFSDDGSAAVCARMVSDGLARLETPVTLALQPHLAQEAAGTGLPPGISIVAFAGRSNGFDVEQALRTASRSGGTVAAALPLSRVDDNVVRGQFDAVITVGASPAAAARAMRAARYDAGSDGSARAGSHGRVPAWFLACSDQAILATKARLSAIDGPALPLATRTLPAVLPRALVAGRGYRDGQVPDGVAGGTAVLLAALSLAVAADPWVKRLDAAGLASLMSARTLPAERALSDRLVGLANAYESLLGTAGADWSGDDLAVSPSRPRDRRAPAARAVPVDRTSAALPARRAYRA
ncbi:hypothetical protein [Methylobacterium oryzae]|uniref:Uncharacterized protein n=1 Tax=Methylobacterium oryzae TaxID=334852 RepID=A0ABU7TTS4_9HYPH